MVAFSANKLILFGDASNFQQCRRRLRGLHFAHGIQCVLHA